MDGCLKDPEGARVVTTTHAKTRTATRFWRSYLLGNSPGSVSKLEQE